MSLAEQVESVFQESDVCIKVYTHSDGTSMVLSCSETNPHKQNASFGPYSMCWGCEKAKP